MSINLITCGIFFYALCFLAELYASNDQGKPTSFKSQTGMITVSLGLTFMWFVLHTAIELIGGLIGNTN